MNKPRKSNAEAIKSTIAQLRDMRREIIQRTPQKTEYFDPGLGLSGFSKASFSGQLKLLIQSCGLQFIALRAEYNCKLIYALDAYLGAVEGKNPLSMYLTARYILELTATILVILRDLQKAMSTDIEQWNVRAFEFLFVMCRARTSSSDPRFTEIALRHGIPSALLKPIKVGSAIGYASKLPGCEFFPIAYAAYSNICHQNGSGHGLFASGVRRGKAVVFPSGYIVRLQKNTDVVTLNYPSEAGAKKACEETLEVVRRCIVIARRAIDEDIPDGPFSEDELRQLTNEEVDNFYPERYSPHLVETAILLSKNSNLRANEPCPCGSGKKYKKCCRLKSFPAVTNS